MSYRLLHWGPMLALSLIAVITWSSFMCLLEWLPVTSAASLFNVIVFFLWDVLTLYNFFLAILVGPGYVPFGWKPVSIVAYIVYLRLVPMHLVDEVSFTDYTCKWIDFIC